MINPTPVSRSRLPLLAIGAWVALLVTVIGVGLAFGARGASGSGPAGANGIALSAPLAADPSASPGSSANPGQPTDNGGWRGPNGMGFGRGHGPGGPGGFGDRGMRGDITITAINGSQLSLKTADGWTRTIDAANATVTEQDGTKIAVGDLKVGDQIRFEQTRNTDGTYGITAIVRIPPQADGTVKSVDANSAVLTQPDGTTKTIGLTGSTKYTMDGKDATAADLKVGTRAHATGTVNASGDFTATTVDIDPAMVSGTVTAKTDTTITIKDRSGASVTINVGSATTYETRGSTTASLANIKTGDFVSAQGTLNGDGSLTATTVDYGTPGQGGPGMGPMGGGPGMGPMGGWGRGHGGPQNGGNGNGTSPNGSPAPSGGTNG